MSILYFLLTLLACAVCGVGGAFGMRFVIERNREIAELEDPRDTRIRDLQAKVKLAANDMVSNRRKAETATEHVEFAHERINQLLGEVKDLKATLESEQSMQGNSSEEKELLHNKLSAANKQLETMRQRNQELEIELSVVNEPDMLTSDSGDSNDDVDSDDDTDAADPFTPTPADNSPSLIQALTGELDRWKHHCHVLGDELKNQRQQDPATSESSSNAAAAPVFDELTDIRGIGVVLARKLHTLGIFRYEDLLELDSAKHEQARELIPDFDRRLQRDDWLEQARLLNESKHCPDVAHAEPAVSS